LIIAVIAYIGMKYVQLDPRLTFTLGYQLVIIEKSEKQTSYERKTKIYLLLFNF